MTIFIVLFVIYIIGMIILGFFASKRSTDSKSFANSNGDLSVLAVSITFGATFASAGTFLGVAGQGFAYGVTNLWFWASQWTSAGIIMAIMARRYRKMNMNKKSESVADWIADRYGSQGLRVWIAIISLFQIMAIASQLVGAGVLIHYMIPSISYNLGVVIACVVIIIYLFMGGAYAHIYTNVAQGAMMIIIALVLALSGFFLFGNIFTEVPAKLAEIDPNLALGLNPNNGGYNTVLKVIGLFVAHFWWAMNPQLISKATYLKSEKDVRKFCWMGPLCMFLMCSVVWAGSYTRILVPEGLGGVIAGMDYAVPYYVNTVFPPFISALFLVVIMAAMMSTVDGMVLYVSTVVGCSLYKNTIVANKRAKGEKIDDVKVEKTTMTIMKWVTVIVGIIAIPIAFTKPANLTVMLWGAAGPIMSAVAGPVLLGIYSKRIGKGGAAFGSVIAVALFCLLYFGKIIGSVYLCCGISGLASILLCFIGQYIFKPCDKELVDSYFSGLKKA